MTWKSGDWRKHPRSSKPFNGLKIVAIPTYDASKKLHQLKLKVSDFTKTASGAVVTHTFDHVEAGHEVHLKPEGRFTASGILQIESSSLLPDSYWLKFTNGSYGLSHGRRHVIGGILEVPKLEKATSPMEHRAPSTPSFGFIAQALPSTPSYSVSALPLTPPLTPPLKSPSSKSSPDPPGVSPLAVSSDGAGGFHLQGQVALHLGERPMRARVQVHVLPHEGSGSRR